MTLYEFTALDLHERANSLWAKGIFLDNYGEGEKRINLYFLGNFYVEVTLSDTTTQEIKEITPFKTGLRFDKYLEKIRLAIT